MHRSDLCMCVCVAAGSQWSVPVLVSGPSVRLSILLNQSRPPAGDVPTRRSDQPSTQGEGQRSHACTHRSPSFRSGHCQIDLRVDNDH